MNPPRISVVIPLYNHARFAADAVRSVLDQEPRDLELIVVDDGSTDESVAVVEAIPDPRLRLLRQKNQGAHAAINRGLEESRGQFLAILNSDDRFSPGRLRAALDVFDRQPRTALVGSWIQLIDDAGRRISVKHGYDDLDPWPVAEPAKTFKADRDLNTVLLHQNYWATTSNYVFPRSTWERHGPFRPLRFAHDWDFALRAQREGVAHLIEAPLVEYRIHGTNTIRTDRPVMVYEICWVLAVHVTRHLAAPAFWQAGERLRSEQILRSIHVYGCDKVLWAMTLHIQHGPQGAEMRLLDPQDPARLVYLAEIERTLAVLEPSTTAAPPPPPVGGMARYLRRLRTALGRSA